MLTRAHSRDAHKRVYQGTTMDGEGLVVERGRFSNNPEGFYEFMDGVEALLVAMEAGYC